MSGASARADFWGGLLWCAAGAGIVLEALRMDRFTQQGASLYTMPGFVPGILGGLIFLLGVVLCVRRSPKNQRLEPVTHLFSKRTVVAAGLSLLYAGALLGRLPFWLATFLFVTAFTYLFYESEAPNHSGARWRTAILSGALSTATVIGIFQFVFLVRLP